MIWVDDTGFSSNAFKYIFSKITNKARNFPQVFLALLSTGNQGAPRLLANDSCLFKTQFHLYVALLWLPILTVQHNKVLQSSQLTTDKIATLAV